jgi:hypothetical protein
MMKQISLLCTLFLLLVTSGSAYAGVTDGDVTAYRLAGNTKYVVFTDDHSTIQIQLLRLSERRICQ